MQFHRCPVLWLNNVHSVLSWYNEFYACKEGLCGKPDYKNRQSRWYDAERIYSGAKANIQVLMAEQGKDKKTDDGLKALKFGLEKRKKQNAG
jgi:hypothetical protein